MFIDLQSIFLGLARLHHTSFFVGEFSESQLLCKHLTLSSLRQGSTISNRSIRLAIYDSLFTFLRQFPVQRAF